jgi:hypothetical protein
MIRLLLVLSIILLIARAFIIYGSSKPVVKKKHEPEDKNKKPRNGVPKSIGEYVDYEEADKSAKSFLKL